MLDLPNPLIIHGLNVQYTQRYLEYFARYSAQFKQIPPAQEAKDDVDADAVPAYELHFPPDAHIVAFDEVREGYTWADISFGGGGLIRWYRMTKLGTGVEFNRIAFSPAEFKTNSVSS